jgi:hypothetical protein
LSKGRIASTTLASRMSQTWSGSRTVADKPYTTQCLEGASDVDNNIYPIIQSTAITQSLQYLVYCTPLKEFWRQ